LWIAKFRRHWGERGEARASKLKGLAIDLFRLYIAIRTLFRDKSLPNFVERKISMKF
jgi:hypothetical protein